MNTAMLQKTSSGTISRVQKYKKNCKLTSFLLKKMVRHLLSDIILTKMATVATHVMLVSGLRPK